MLTHADDGSRLWLKFGDRTGMAAGLKVGDTVERHLQVCCVDPSTSRVASFPLDGTLQGKKLFLKSCTQEEVEAC